MILCVSLSPAWDVTYHVDRLRPHGSHRARAVSGRAGGKAVNVARVLRALGEDATVLAPVGGPTGTLFADDLAAAGLPLVRVPEDGDLRRTVTVVSDETGDATIVNEVASVAHWSTLLGNIEDHLASASVVVVAGSVPTGAPASAVSDIVLAATRHGIPVAVDTSGPALSTLLAAAPVGLTLVKANLAELQEVTHAPDACEAARRLSAESGAAVVVTLGSEGMVLSAGGHTWGGRGGEALHGNPTGAGDAAMAALVRAVAHGTPWPEVLADAVAVAGAAVLAPYAGMVDLEDRERLAAQVVVRATEVRA